MIRICVISALALMAALPAGAEMIASGDLDIAIVSQLPTPDLPLHDEFEPSSGDTCGLDLSGLDLSGYSHW